VPPKFNRKTYPVKLLTGSGSLKSQAAASGATQTLKFAVCYRVYRGGRLMKFNREIFYAEYKKQFGALSPLQVKGLNRLLNGYETYYGWWDNLWQIASSLAQIKHETAHTFNPVVEAFYVGDPDKPGFYLGNTERVRRVQRSFRYYPHFGMGDIQLTWEENYAEQDGLIRKYFPERVADFERRTKQKFNLIEHPTQVLDPWISFCVMTIGMHKGTFRDGHSLDRYFNGKVCDPFGAREIVNGDKHYKIKGTNIKIGDRIASDTKKFAAVLRAAQINDLTPDNVSDAIDLLQIDDVSRSLDAAVPAYPTVEPTQDDPLDDSPHANLPRDSAEFPQPELPAPNANDGTEIPLGDASDQPARWKFNVEDWKPWVFEKLSLTWRSFGGVNLTSGTTTLIAAWQSGRYWYVPLIIGGLLFLLTLVVCAVLSLILLAVWYFNRREIKDYKTEELRSRNDPNLYNFGINIEKI